MDTADQTSGPHHHRRLMAGRDPHEAHRVATPLELLFDLTFVIAFGAAPMSWRMPWRRITI